MRYKVEYGWCYTDHNTNGKDGHYIREQYSRGDYLYGEEYQEFTREAFDTLALPFPEKDDIYRGTAHDMLFLDSHGLVVRVGPCDVQDLFHPAILQPIGWYSADDIKVTNIPESPTVKRNFYSLGVSIYPGIELFDDVLKKGDEKRKSYISGMWKTLHGTSHKALDINGSNLGLITIANDEKVAVVLDIDNNYNNPKAKVLAARRDVVLSNVATSSSMAEVMEKSISGIFNGRVDKKFFKAFEHHQPLRQQFWSADYEKAKLEDLWDKCAGLTLDPEEFEFPVWRKEEGGFVRHNLVTSTIKLVSPWSRKTAGCAV